MVRWDGTRGGEGDQIVTSFEVTKIRMYRGYGRASDVYMCMLDEMDDFSMITIRL